jgi:hypothetical protein
MLAPPAMHRFAAANPAGPAPMIAISTVEFGRFCAIRVYLKAVLTGEEISSCSVKEFIRVQPMWQNRRGGIGGIA